MHGGEIDIDMWYDVRDDDSDVDGDDGGAIMEGDGN